MSIHLSPRLLAVARLVPQGARVIDVGTDHAMIPVWLAQNQIAGSIWASDIREGPLESAAALIRKTGTGDRIRTRLTDGLSGFGPEDGNTVILAGMGGETMVSILAEAPWTRRDTLLILEPQSKQDVLRRFLWGNGYRIRSESLVRDAGRIYPILTAAGGEAQAFSEAEAHTGLASLIENDPLYGEYLDGWIQRTRTAAPYDPKARDLLRQLEERKETLRHDDG